MLVGHQALAMVLFDAYRVCPRGDPIGVLLLTGVSALVQYTVGKSRSALRSAFSRCEPRAGEQLVNSESPPSLGGGA